MTSIDPAVLRRFRRRRLARRLAGIAVSVVFTLALIEVLLRVTDPFGAVYFHDLANNFYDVAIDDPRGYVVPPGEYHASHWSFSILPDHTRAVPDTNADAEREMVFVGDSVTFGYGVEDAETFVNLVAQAFPDWHIVNEAYPGWNIQNLEHAWEQHPDADLIFVLTINNDLDEPYREIGNMRSWKPLYIQSYAMLVSWIAMGFPTASEAEVAALEPGWIASIERMAADPRVTFLTMDTTSDYEQKVAALAPDQTVILKNFTGLVSTVDSHPNPASHIFITEQLVPVIEAKIAALDGE